MGKLWPNSSLRNLHGRHHLHPRRVRPAENSAPPRPPTPFVHRSGLRVLRRLNSPAHYLRRIEKTPSGRARWGRARWGKREGSGVSWGRARGGARRSSCAPGFAAVDDDTNHRGVKADDAPSNQPGPCGTVAFCEPNAVSLGHCCKST